MAVTTFPFQLATQNAQPLDADYIVPSGTDEGELASHIKNSPTAYAGQLLYVVDESRIYKVTDPANGDFRTLGETSLFFEAQTTDATPTTLVSAGRPSSMPQNAVWVLTGHVVAQSSTGAAAWDVEAVWASDNTDPPALSTTGSPTITQITQGTVLDDASVRAKSDGDVPTIEVTGLSGTTIGWRARMTVTAS